MRHLGLQGLSYEELCGKGANQIGFAQVDVERAARYSCEDADFTFRVHQMLWPRIQQSPGLERIYALEIESSESLYRMERHGVLIDAQVLAQQSHELGQRILELERQSHELAGQPFNL